MIERRRLALFFLLLLLVFFAADRLDWPTPFGPAQHWNAK